ncbi:MAG: biopolymer transporter ExbD [Gemmatimonadaceae bacterium]|nr:biopolymer transporter ExbD [Gemmatimonadaceae bacterium]
MAMSAGGGGNVKAEPNVTPMIDVMLVLLIIFMVVAPALLAGFNATPPQGQNLKAHPTNDETDQTLGIDKDGKYYLNKQPIRYEDIQPRLTQIFQNRTEDRILYVKADKNLDYSKVLDALDIAAKSGVAMTGMISDQRPGTSSVVEGDNPTPATPGGKP